LELVQEQWNEAKNFQQQAWPKKEARLAWMEWDHRFTLYDAEMSTLNTIDEIIAKSKIYYAILPNKDPFADVLTAKSFVNVTAMGMQFQFESAIMEPYWKMFEATTLNPTMDPTANPTTAEPTFTFQPTSPPTLAAGAHWIAAGDPSQSSWSGVPSVECMDNTNRHSTELPENGRDIAVTCCAEGEQGGVRGVSEFEGECFQTKTWYEANAICDQNGYRLCTLGELLEDGVAEHNASSTQVLCGHEARYNWVATECSLDESAHYVHKGDTNERIFDWASQPDYYCQSDSQNQAAYFSIDYDLDIAVGCCRDNWGSSLYHIFSNFATNWHDANAYCQNNYGTTLATIRDADDWGNLIREMTQSTMGNGEFWVGLSDLGNEGQWTFQSGFECEGGNCRILSYWATGQPDNAGLGEHCGNARAATSDLIDLECSFSRYFICDAPELHELVGYRPDCDAFPRTYEEAEQLCYSKFARLCTIKEMQTGLAFDECSRNNAYMWVSNPCQLGTDQAANAAHVGIADIDAKDNGDGAVDGDEDEKAEHQHEGYEDLWNWVSSLMD